jgi:hypothetical protein
MIAVIFEVWPKPEHRQQTRAVDAPRSRNVMSCEDNSGVASRLPFDLDQSRLNSFGNCFSALPASNGTADRSWISLCCPADQMAAL